VQRAINEDRKQNYGEAHRQYLSSVNYFKLALKCNVLLSALPIIIPTRHTDEKTDKNKRLIQSKITEYLSRADALKEYLKREKSKKNAVRRAGK
jgi:vacuolar protein-sorting-associated protein 4